MVALKVKTRSGMVQTLNVEALIEIDGKRYVRQTEEEERMEQLEHRLELLERLLVPVTVEATGDDESTAVAI